jgi:FtsP/CotA-like multicopper oxidase with cupredoxin domain
MFYKNGKIIPSNFLIFSLLTFSVICVSIQGKPGSVYAQTTLFPQQMSSQIQTHQQQVLQYDKEKNCATDQHTPTTYITYLTHFSCGHITVFNNGTVLRKFTLLVDDFNGSGKPYPITTNQMDPMFTGTYDYVANHTKYQPVIFHAWTFNGTIPGPTIRVTQGDHVQVTVINSKDSKFPHSWHVHSIHSGINDGTMTASGMIFPGSSYTYDFVATPAGLYPYHCHMTPVEEHVSRGLYGMMIIDPPHPRPAAKEMVMMLNEYTFSYMGADGKGHLNQTVPATESQILHNLTAVEDAADEGNGPDNQFYTVNGMVFGYTGPHEIQLKTGVNYRIYLVNMVEFDPLNNFHLHGAMFTYTPSCTISSSKMYTDIVSLMQGDRGCVDMHFLEPGMFMFHSHLNHFTDLGWLGVFNVTGRAITTRAS